MFKPFYKIASVRTKFEQDVAGGLITMEILQAECEKLFRELRNNKAIRELANTKGWEQLDAYLSKRMLALHKQVLEEIVKGQTQEALAHTCWIQAANDIMGLVNRTVYDTTLLAEAIDSKLTMLQKLESHENG